MCKVIDGDPDLIGKDCINPDVGGEENPFFTGEGKAGDPCPYQPATVEITYEVCNLDAQYDLILDQKKTVLMYDSTDITPTSFYADPIAPEACVTHVYEVTWDLCDVPDVTGTDMSPERTYPYSIKAVGYLKGEVVPPSKGKGGGKGGSKGGSKGSTSSKSGTDLTNC